MATTVDVTMPSSQAEGTESFVATWFKAVGDQVTANEPLLEISTDKVNMEIAAPASGVLTVILKQDGEQIEPGERLGTIDTAGNSAKPAESSPQADGSEKMRAGTSGAGSATSAGELSPAVRRLLQEHQLDASQIAGTGKGGRITHQDVMDFIGSSGTAARSSASGSAESTHPGLPGASKAPGAGSQASSGIPGRVVPHTQMRRSIAQHMVQSLLHTAPHVTSVFDADLSSVIGHRDAHRSELESRGARLTYTAYFVKATVEALRAVPEANSRWHDDGLEILDDYNIGIATALDSGGLIVPVIMKAQDLDLFGIAQRLDDLTERARSGSLDPRDVQNGTFTISNHGVSGSLVATPIVINQPQSAILGVGKLERRPVAEDVNGKEEIVVRPMCYVTLTIDHRVLDGFKANQFLTAWVRAIEDF
jgi:2-oxoglutarate dehydrogenase E2 component (dihydrolipoamide succinyltransferase)